MQAALTAEFGKMSGPRLSPDKKRIEDIISMLEKLTINVALNDPVATYCETRVQTVDVSRWVEVQKGSDVIEGMVNDAMDDPQNLSVARSGLEKTMTMIVVPTRGPVARYLLLLGSRNCFWG